MFKVSMTAMLIAATLAGAADANMLRGSAAPRPIPPLAVSRPVAPISAWTTMCQTYPGECTFNPSEPERVTLSADLMAMVVKVNRTVNAVIEPMEDQAHWGVADRWDFAEDGKGDCEDYQLVKRRLLIGIGIPLRALRMTVVIDEIEAGHAVLLLRSTIGDFVLDNKTNALLPWHRTGYTFVKRESSTVPGEWVSLVTAPVDVTGAQ